MLHRFLTAMTHGSGRRGLALVLILVAATGGAAAILVAVLSQQSAPEPPASAAGAISSSAPASTSTSTPITPTPSGGQRQPSTPAPSSTPEDPSLTASDPTYIDIPAIAVHSSIIALGKAADGTLAVPQPGPNLNKVAWYKNSVTPGQAGPSVIEGHVDTTEGPSIFFRLGALRPGNTIEITRADHSVALFTVNAVRAYPSHADFPETTVFGGDLAQPTLRLITCSNFDSSIGHYVGNTIVYAHLTSSRPAHRSS